MDHIRVISGLIAYLAVIIVGVLLYLTDKKGGKKC